ncbi:MAG: MBL fold metallo-hydrolase [Sphingorhabdus sp.]
MRARSKIVIAVAGLLLIAFLAVKSQQSAIGFFLFDRAVGDRAGRDNTADLPDGLHVALCGTGSPLPSPSRAGPCNIVIAGKQMFVVDVGEGGGRNVALMGLPVGRIEAIFLTHFHSDHIDGIGPLMLTRWTAGTNKAPLPIYGPTGVERVVAGFNAAYATDNVYRTGHHGAAIAPPEGAGSTAMPFALPGPGKGDTAIVFAKNGVRVTAIRVDHEPVEPAVGYRFDYKGRSIVISGDTAKSTSLAKASKGTDLLIHEALQPALVKMMTTEFEAKGIKNLAQITRDIVDYHTTPEQAAEVAKAAGAKQLVLTHIVPPIPSKFFYPAFLGDAASRYSGPIVVGEDGMLFTLPANKPDIVRRRLM